MRWQLLLAVNNGSEVFQDAVCAQASRESHLQLLRQWAQQLANPRKKVAILREGRGNSCYSCLVPWIGPGQCTSSSSSFSWWALTCCTCKARFGSGHGAGGKYKHAHSWLKIDLIHLPLTCFQIYGSACWFRLFNFHEHGCL